MKGRKRERQGEREERMKEGHAITLQECAPSILLAPSQILQGNEAVCTYSSIICTPIPPPPPSLTPLLLLLLP